MFLIVPHLLDWIMAYKYAVLFPASVLEGPIVTVVSGFLVAQDFLNGFVVFMVIIIGDLVGDTLYYSIGRWGRQTLINRWGKYIGVDGHKVLQLEEHFDRHGSKTLLLGKLTQGIGGVILIAAGGAQMPYWRFLWLNAIGTIPKTLALLIVGYYFGKAYMTFNRYLNYTALGMIILAMLAILFYGIVIKKLTKKIRL